MFANSPCSNVPSHGPFGRNTRKALGAPERNDEHTERQTHSKCDRTMVDATNHAVEVYPPGIVKRRAVTWDGMAAEIVQATRREKIEFRFRAPLHLLAVCDQGMRNDGDTFVEGLPRSKLRDASRKLTFVPAGHEYYEWQEPRVLARIVHFYFDPSKMPTHPRAGATPISLAP